MRPWLARVLATLLVGASGAAAAAVSASVDRTRLGAGDSVQLTVQTDDASGEPDLGPLARDFDILGRSSSTSYQLVNGRASTQRQLILTIVPRHGGAVQVPALHWGAEQSQPIALQVASGGAAGGAGAAGVPSAAGAASGAAASAHVFLTSRTDSPQPYVQAGVALTVRLYSDGPLYQASLDLPDNGDVLVQPIGKDSQSEQTLDGRSYSVYARHYMLFPLRSGKIVLAGPVLDAQVPAGTRADPMFGRLFGSFGLPGIAGATRPLRLHGDPITLQVRPRPAGFDGRHWLPAQQLTLTETWQPAQGAAQVGEPLTRHLSLRALGLSAAQLPDLNALIALPPGLKAYPDQPKLTNAQDGATIVGRRDQDIAFIADRPGRYELPALHLRWWDTKANVARELVLPAHALEIVPAAGGAARTPASAPAPSPAASPVVSPRSTRASAPIGPPRRSDEAAVARWRWVSLGLGLLWIATAAGWATGAWRRRSRRALPADAARAAVARRAPAPGAAREAWLRACRGDDPLAARAAALAWAAVRWSDAPPVGLNALARRLAEPALTPLLHELDRACSRGGGWRGQALAAAVAALPKAAAPLRVEAALPALYADAATARPR